MNKVAPLLLLVTAMVVADISGQWPEHSVSKIWTSRIVLIALRTRIRSVCVFSISRRCTSCKGAVRGRVCGTSAKFATVATVSCEWVVEPHGYTVHTTIDGPSLDPDAETLSSDVIMAASSTGSLQRAR